MTNITPNPRAEASTAGTPKTARIGGFVHAAWGFLVGGIIGAWLSLASVDIVANFTTMTTKQLEEVNSVPARVAVVVAAAALIAFIGLLLDVLHKSDGPRYDFAVRQMGLIAGTTAVVGSWIALPATANAALTFWVVLGLIAIAIGALIVGVALKSKPSAAAPAAQQVKVNPQP